MIGRWLFSVFLLMVLGACVGVGEGEASPVQIASYDEKEQEAVMVTDTVFWEDSWDNITEDSSLLKLAFEYWKKEGKYEVEEQSFQEFSHSISLLKSYPLGANTLLLIIGMPSDDNVFELLVLDKDTTTNQWWVADEVSYYTRYVLKEHQVNFDTTTGLILLTVGEFHSSEGDASSKILLKVLYNKFQEVGNIFEDGFFDFYLEWESKNSRDKPCEIDGLFSYHSDWTVVDKNTLHLTYHLEVLFTHQEPYPWPDADTILLDTFFIVYTWQDSAQAFAFNSQQTVGIQEQAFENFQYGHLSENLKELLLQKMRVNTRANYFTVPCIEAALRERKMPKQVY